MTTIRELEYEAFPEEVRPSRHPLGLDHLYVEFDVAVTCRRRVQAPDRAAAEAMLVADIFDKAHHEPSDVRDPDADIEVSAVEAELPGPVRRLPAAEPETISIVWGPADAPDPAVEAEVRGFRAELDEVGVAGFEVVDEPSAAVAEPPPLPVAGPDDPEFDVRFRVDYWCCAMVWARDEEHAAALIREDVMAFDGADALDSWRSVAEELVVEVLGVRKARRAKGGGADGR
jgi:hypothetical protein